MLREVAPNPLVRRLMTVALCGALCVGCTRVKPVHAEASVQPTMSPEVRVSSSRDIRATGTIQAVRAFTVQVPQISGIVTQSNSRLTLVKLVPNGTRVSK